MCMPQNPVKYMSDPRIHSKFCQESLIHGEPFPNLTSKFSIWTEFLKVAQNNKKMPIVLDCSNP